MTKRQKKIKKQEILFDSGIIKTPYLGNLFIETIFKPSVEKDLILFATYRLDKVNQINPGIIAYETRLKRESKKYIRKDYF